MPSLRHAAAGLLVGAVSVTAASVHYARDAAGCGGGDSWLGHPLPGDGDPLPQNSSILFFGENLELDLSLTVDGAPAGLIPTTVVPTNGDLRGVALATPPALGAAVNVIGDACYEPPCDVDLNFLVTEPDTTAPPEMTSLTFDLFDVVGNLPIDCPELVVGSHFYISPSAPAEAEPGAALVWKLEVFADSTLATPLRVQIVKASVPPPYELRLPQVDSPDACVRATLIDLAGNASAPKVACKPCNYDAGAEVPVGPPTQPYPGGPCDNGQGGSGGGASTTSSSTGGVTNGGAGGAIAYGFPPDNNSDSDSGCAVHTPRSRAGALGLIAMIVLGISLVRRSRE